MRTRVQNALQSIALTHGLRLGKSLWSKAGQQALAFLPLAEHSRQRTEALQLFYTRLQKQIDELDKTVSDLAHERPQAHLLMTHPGVGRSQPWRRKYSWERRGDSRTERPLPAMWE